MNGLNERDIGNAVSSLVLNILARELHTAMPGKITKVYSVDGKTAVDVQPLLKMAVVNGSQKQFSIATGVMLLSIGTTVSSVIMPVNKDDLVLLVYSERALDKWSMDTKISETIHGRQFDLSDAFAIPFNFDGLSTALTNNDMIIKHEGQTIIIKKNGDIELGSGSLSALVTDAIISVLTTTPDSNGGKYMNGTFNGCTTSKVKAE